ncbi:MAG: hypothetical protein AAF089_13720 [Bacteroidota bacterium]
MSTDVSKPVASDTPEQDKLRARLAAQEASMKARFDTLQHEVTRPLKALPFVGGTSSEPGALARVVRENPLAFAAGAVALTALASFVLGMRKKRKKRLAPNDHQQLVTAYLSTVINDASARMARGKSADEALDLAFRRRPPVIVYGDTEVSTTPKQRRTLIREGMRAAGNQAVRVGLSYALGRFQLAPSADFE